MRNRSNGVLIAMENCTTIAYALFNLQKRGKLFLCPGIKVYKGQIVGEHCREYGLSGEDHRGPGRGGEPLITVLEIHGERENRTGEEQGLLPSHWT